jgi:hypothetical protein
MTTHAELSPQIDRDVVEYRRVSGWAVCSVLLGLLSATALAGPVFWIVPAMGIGVSLVALWKIAGSRGEMSGWYAALLGLIVSIFFGAAGPARTLTRQYWLETRAKTFAGGFIDFLQQRQMWRAYQLTMHPVSRKPLPPNNADAQKEYREFVQLPAVEAFMAHGEEAQFEILSTKALGGDGNREWVLVRYRLQYPDGDKMTTLDGQMYLERSLLAAGGDEQWQILPPAMRAIEP